MPLRILPTLHIQYDRDGDGPQPHRAIVELDDGTSITIKQLDGPSPSPSFLIEEFTTLEGFSRERFGEFINNPQTHVNFARIWHHYLEFEANGSEKSINDELRARMLLALETSQLVLRLEGRDTRLLAIGDRVSAHLVFFGYGSVRLGIITDIKLL